MYDRNNGNMETITYKVNYTFNKMQCVALILQESIEIITTNLFSKSLLLFFFNWDSPHAQDTENLFRKNLQLKDVC